MKAYYYEVNGYIKGVTEAKNRWEAKRYCKKLAKTFCPNARIKSVKVSRIRTDEPSPWKHDHGAARAHSQFIYN